VIEPRPVGPRRKQRRAAFGDALGEARDGRTRVRIPRRDGTALTRIRSLRVPLRRVRTPRPSPAPPKSRSSQNAGTPSISRLVRSRERTPSVSSPADRLGVRWLDRSQSRWIAQSRVAARACNAQRRRSLAAAPRISGGESPPLQSRESKLPPCRVVSIGDLQEWGDRLHVTALVERPASDTALATVLLPLTSLRHASVARVLRPRRSRRSRRPRSLRTKSKSSSSGWLHGKSAKPIRSGPTGATSPPSGRSRQANPADVAQII
jgi:hypothetical protein